MSETRVLDALRYFRRLNKIPTSVDLARKAEVPAGSLTACLLGLERKGHAKNFGRIGAPDWRPLQADSALATNGALTAADLSLRQRSVLVLIAKGGGVLSDSLIKHAGIEMDELPRLLYRLRELELIEIGDGRWKLLGLGEKIVAEIRSTPGPAPIDTTISMPKIKAPPLKSDPEARAAIDNFQHTNGVRKFPEGDSASQINVAEYLEKKGHVISGDTVWKTSWTIDGKLMEWSEIVALVNIHRTRADLPPLTFP